MEGAREFQISVEYQIYCLFYFFDSWLKFKIPVVKYSNKFKWTSRRLAGELPLILYENSIISCLYSYIRCFILILCNHMLFSQIITTKLPAANLSFYVSSRHLTVKQSVKIDLNLPDNLSIFLVKISSYTNNYDSVENKKSENACFY